MRKLGNVVVAVLFACEAGACGGSGPAGDSTGDPASGQGAASSSGSLTDRLQALNQDLGQGSQGDGVRAVYEYLAQAGYFPNEQLQRSYPAWRPIVPQAPASTDVYDERMTNAVSALQANSGLQPTGIIDQPTRTLLLTPRCGVPDGIPRLDPSDKFDTYHWLGHPITWCHAIPPVGPPVPSDADAHAAERAAVATWQAEISQTITEVSCFSHYDFQFSWVAGDPSYVGRTVPNMPDTGQYTIQMNYGYQWGTSNPPALPGPSGQACPDGKKCDVQSVMTHEVGHALGLSHSGFSSAKMYGPYNFQRSLNIDDQVGISTLYDAWQQVCGGLKDIGVGADGVPWGISPNNTVWKWNGSCWTLDQSGGMGTAIAGAPDGRPWLVGLGGDIWRYSNNNPSTGHFDFQAGGGCAIDIGVGGDGSVWVIGCGGTDGSVYRFNDTHTSWVYAGGAGKRIAVGPTGIPWVTTSNQTIWRKATNDPVGWTWTQLPGLGLDIAVSPTVANQNSYAWVIGIDRSIQAWDQQPGGGGGPPAQAITGAWWHMNAYGFADRVTVDQKGEPWVVDATNGVISRPVQ